MKDKKKIIIGTLCALIMIMAVGYALLSQQLSINGTANITSTWKIEITNITENEKHGGVTEKSKSYDAMTANFNVGFTSPGDYIIYEVEVTNSGTLDAVIERVNIETNDNPAIIYTTSGIKRGDVIAKNSKKYLTVKIEYDSSVTSQPQTNNNALTIQLFTEQNMGQVQVYDEYSIGDKIRFAGSSWYVIKDSTDEDDYVKLMKEKVLTNAELGSYAYGNGYDTAKFDNSSNDYDSSSLKSFLEGEYLNTIGSDNLKEVSFRGTNYKIRVISVDELSDSLAYIGIESHGSFDYIPTSSSPTWCYQNYGEDQNNVYGYWTMSPLKTSFVYKQTRYDSGNYYVSGHYPYTANMFGVRPVINLLKSAIE